jgi:hypothetical protein
MAHYPILEEFIKNFKLCTNSETGEVGTSGHRQHGVNNVMTALVAALKAADDFQKKGMTQQVRTESKINVKQMAAWHTAQQTANKQAEQNRLNQEVIKLRKWLSRQGVWFEGRGYTVNWEQSMRLKIYYDSEARQAGKEVIVIGNRLLYAETRKPVDTGRMVSHFAGPGNAIYVMSSTGRLYLASHSVGVYHHSSLLAGAPVACAGEIRVTNGLISYLSNKSGHYVPQQINFFQVLGMLQECGSDLHFPVKFHTEKGKTVYFSVEDFIRDHQMDAESLNHLAITIKKVVVVPTAGSSYDSGAASSAPIVRAAGSGSSPASNPYGANTAFIASVVNATSPAALAFACVTSTPAPAPTVVAKASSGYGPGY